MRGHPYTSATFNPIMTAENTQLTLATEPRLHQAPHLRLPKYSSSFHYRPSTLSDWAQPEHINSPESDPRGFWDMSQNRLSSTSSEIPEPKVTKSPLRSHQKRASIPSHFTDDTALGAKVLSEANVVTNLESLNLYDTLNCF